jgi:hypothetical protein
MPQRTILVSCITHILHRPGPSVIVEDYNLGCRLVLTLTLPSPTRSLELLRAPTMITLVDQIALSVTREDYSLALSSTVPGPDFLLLLDTLHPTLMPNS